jgi:hypothetical protein
MTLVSTAARGGGSSTTSPGAELDYVEKTSDTTITATTEGTSQAWVTGNSITLDGATSVLVYLYSPIIDTENTASGELRIVLYDGATVLGEIARYRTSAAGDTLRDPLFVVRKLVTPSNGTHQYIGKAYNSAVGNGIVRGAVGGSGTYMPAFVRVTRA